MTDSLRVRNRMAVRFMGPFWWILAQVVWLCSMFPAAASGNPASPPDAEVVRQVQQLIAGMKASEKGPYARIRWFCNDGSVLPPQAYACRSHGGGLQHAEYSEERNGLSALGYNVGTIFASLDWDEFFDANRRHQRLRELPLERYLTDIDDGWVLARAGSYRGRVQVEDETRLGRNLLLRLLGDRAWVNDHYLLTREVVRVVPHGVDTDLGRSIRRDIQELAANNPTAEPLRVEIHTAPSAASARKVRDWAALQQPDAKTAAESISERLDTLFGTSDQAQRLKRLLAGLQPELANHPLLRGLTSNAAPVESLSWPLMADLRAVIESDVSAAARLTLFDLVTEALDVLLAGRVVDQPLTRAEHLQRLVELADGVYGAGLFNPNERDAMHRALELSTPSLIGYSETVRQLQRAPQWAMGSVRYSFAEPLMRYTAIDSRAARFADDLLRNSPLMQMAGHTRILALDLQALSGVGVRVFGEAPVGVIGLNAGMAKGTLRVALDATEGTQFERNDIVVLPETSAELSLISGILTLGEGNPLSHVQLLARNFGIPNVAISAETLPLLRRHQGRAVMLTVGTDGSVVLMDATEADAVVGDLLSSSPGKQTMLTIPPPDLSVAAPLPLADLHRGLSGRVVGPKAANLGELNRLFPGRVAPAVAIPFGVFARYTGDESGIRARLEKAYAGYRRGDLTETALAEALEQLRQEIAATALSAETRADIRAAVDRTFTEPDTGAFVRSDTNVEDLTEFTGAGLSETLPNVVGRDRQIDSIPRVWASVLSPRAIAWRSNLLSNPADVYASVLLMQSVPATKSGVLITANLVEPQLPGLTVSTAWGVGGAVSGEAASTLVLGSDGAAQTVSDAKAPYQRALNPDGGIRWLPARQGPVLTPSEQEMVRALAAEVGRRYDPALDADGRPRPWDIEFGFVDSELVLFQIRPLVERGQQLTNRVLRLLLPPAPEPVASVDLSEQPESGVFER